MSSTNLLLAPSITNEDLQAFQRSHFGHLGDTSVGSFNEDESIDYDHEELGYYPDGTQRTLTDQQVAMFRHSEIQRLLAERRRREESEDGEIVIFDDTANQPIDDTTLPVDRHDGLNISNPSKKKRVQAKDPDCEPAKSPDSSPPREKKMAEWRETRPTLKGKPRKTGPPVWTPRGSARELDNAKVNQIELDY